MEETVLALYLAAGAAYILYAALESGGLAAARPVLMAAILAHGAMLTARGIAIRFFPLTNKFESFTCFALAVMVVLAASRGKGGRTYRLGLFAVGAVFYGLAALFSFAITYPPPLMLTVWYPLHVPASFLAYALWASAAVISLTGTGSAGHRAASESAALGKEAGAAAGVGSPRRAADAIASSHILWGFVLWSLSMFFGGLWGYVAWGHHFLWDQKILWSTILWLFYSVLVHLDRWPAAARARGVFAVIGFLFALMTYVGTSFLTGSSHSF